MDIKLKKICKNNNNCNINSNAEYDLKIFINNIYDIYKYEVIMIIITVMVFNFNFGLMIFVIYLVLFVLNTNENKYTNDKIDNKINDETNKEIKYNDCRPATMDNPYANYLIGDNISINACNDKINITNSDTYNMFNVYENATDINIGSSNKGLKDFYTKPVTSYPANSIEFAKWLYNGQKTTCKIDNNCLRIDDIRYHSR